MDKQLEDIYGHKVRVRACGMCWKEDRLLLVNHKGITATNFWAPPGGGVDFGQTLQQTLIKEFMEETGLRIRPGDFLFGCEYIAQPIHSIELFYDVKVITGEARTGYDPEIQIIEDVQFVSMDQLQNLPTQELHGVFRHARDMAALKSLSGFLRIE